MQFDEIAYDREAEPKSAMSTRRRTIGLAKAIEYERQESRVDPLARIAHANLDAFVCSRERDAHVPSARRELDRVREQIPDDLLEPAGVPHHRVQFLAQRCLEDDLLRLGSRAHRIDRGLD